MASLVIARGNSVSDTTSFTPDSFDRLSTTTYPDAVKPLATGRRVGENTPLENFRGGEPASRRTATESA